MNNQQNGLVILWLTWRKYETTYRLLTCHRKKVNLSSFRNSHWEPFSFYDQGTKKKDFEELREIRRQHGTLVE